MTQITAGDEIAVYNFPPAPEKPEEMEDPFILDYFCLTNEFCCQIVL